MAQAIAHQPELLILDEPFNGLDPIGRFEMTSFLRDWGKSKSLILASHILHEVEAVHPSFLLISGGRLLASGTPDEVHSILADSPRRLKIRSSNAKMLANELVNQCPVESLSFDEDGETLFVTTRSAGQMQSQLAHILSEKNITVQEMTSQDDSLKTLFTTLMQIHRGESRRGMLE